MIDDNLALLFSQSGEGHADKVSDAQTGEFQGFLGYIFGLSLSDELTDLFGNDGSVPPACTNNVLSTVDL